MTNFTQEKNHTMPSKFLILKICSFFLLINLLSCTSWQNKALSQTPNQKIFSNTAFQERDLKGWGHLGNLLLQEGFSKTEIENLIFDKRFPSFTTVTFKSKPKESPNIYRGVVTKKSIQLANIFIRENQNIFKEISEQFHISPKIITALLYVETRLGKNTGEHIVAYRLARLASVGSQKNLLANYRELKISESSTEAANLRERAKQLEKMFLPELVILLKSCPRSNCDVLNILGSNSGAFGFPQFLPSSYNKFALDFNKNGGKSLYEMSDAIASIANYLKAHGWRDSLNISEKRQVIWHYNHSIPYIDTVMQIYLQLP